MGSSCLLPAPELKLFHGQESSGSTLLEKTQAEEGEATAARFLSVPDLQFHACRATVSRDRRCKVSAPCSARSGTQTTHPTGCRGPAAAATNNGTTSVLLGVAVGSGKQEVVLKQGVVVPCQYVCTDTHICLVSPRPPPVSLCPLP